MLSWTLGLMGKFSNGESAAALLSSMLLVASSALHYRGFPEQGDQLVRRPEGAFAQMGRHDRLDGFELFGGIAPRIDFSACQGGMSEPKRDLADVLRRLQHDHRAGVPQDVRGNPLVPQSGTKLTSRLDVLF